MTTPYALGALPSPPDGRDFSARAFYAPGAAPLPAAQSFEGLCQIVRDQGAEGTCVGHALASGVMGYEERAGGHDARILSVRDAYEGARTIEPVTGEGATPRSALKWAAQAGLCLEPSWRYAPQARGNPGPTAADERRRNKLATYAAVAVSSGPQALKEALYWHGPALAVLPVRDGFWRPDGAGLVSAVGAEHGAHAITLVGWDDARQAFRLRNSWGAGWGLGGYCWLPYAYPLTEAWIATPALLPDGDVPPPPAEGWLSRILRALHLEA